MRKYKGNDLGVRQIDEFAVIVSLRKNNLKFLTRQKESKISYSYTVNALLIVQNQKDVKF